MIDVEVELFDVLARLVWETYPTAFVTGTYVDAPPRFPAVFVREVSNMSAEDMEDSSGEENGAVLLYEVEVCSDSATRKLDCRAIADLIDGRMRRWNFRRVFMGPVDNADQPGIYRLIARYSGLVDRNNTFYRR